MTETILISLAILAMTIFILWLLLNLIRCHGIAGFLDWRKECCIRKAAKYGATANTYRAIRRDLPVVYRGYLADEFGVEVER